MRPELQVCNFEQADRLFKLGVFQESAYFYLFYTPRPHLIYLNPKKQATNTLAHALQKFGDDCFVEIRSAYNVSDLALLLNITEGPINAVLLADQLILKLDNKELDLEEVNQRLLDAV